MLVAKEEDGLLLKTRSTLRCEIRVQEKKKKKKKERKRKRNSFLNPLPLSLLHVNTQRRKI